jgi:phosphoribosylaminoimidazole-succinocarboxamide synthase
VLETNLEGLALFNRGKVRDIYAWGDRLLIVATDRISAFDLVLPTGIPLKGKVLTALTEFWLALLSDVTPSHLITTDVSQMGEAVCRHARLLRGRSMLVRKAKVLPIECVVRGYLAGSGWKEYQRSGGICGLRLPRGLREAEELPEPIFTAATKAMSGHDENITFEQAARLAGERLAAEARDRSLALYNRARDYARRRGILIGDTKFEWGLVEGGMILVDEVLTPDSSRFWPAESYEPGHPQPSFDKQFVRDYLMETGWNREPPAPELPPEIVRRTTEKYREAYCRLTGRALAD